MPVNPDPTPWQFPPLASFDPEDDLVAIGADLAPGTLLEAYAAGCFPMPEGDEDGLMLWFSPVARGVLPLEGLKVSRSLRRSLRNFEIRYDTAFEQVLDGCADPLRDGGWIDEHIREAYLRLFELGWAHSVETWRDGALVGGLYGLAIGGLFAGESMFHRVTDASKAALVGLVDLLSAGEDASDRLLDVQWRTDHLATLGVVEIPRAEYFARLQRALRLQLPPAFDS